MKKIFVINGSASKNSSNEKLIENIEQLTKDWFSLTVFNSLKELPHFDPELSITDTPKKVLEFRRSIETADGVLICTPEYVFSIPSGLKNAIEWCIATTVFSDKPTGMITASASGEKGHAELQLIMKTVFAKYTQETTLLIQGIKGKINEGGIITDRQVENDLAKFISEFRTLIEQ